MMNALNLNHDPAILFKEGFRDLFDSKAVSILDIKEDPYSDDRHFIGWEDHEYYYLILGNVMKGINFYFQLLGIKFPISKYMLAKLLAERQLIEVEHSESKACNIIRAYVGKNRKQTRVLKLKKSALL